MQLTAHYLTNALVSFSNHSRASSSTPSNNGPTFLLTSSLYSLSHSNSSGDKSVTSTKSVEMGTYCVAFGPSANSKKAEAWALTEGRAQGRPRSRPSERGGLTMVNLSIFKNCVPPNGLGVSAN